VPTLVAQPARSWKGHKAQATAVAFSPNGKLLASRGADNRVRLWAVVSGAEVGAWECPTPFYSPGLEPTQALRFSADGKSLVAAGHPTPRVHEAATGRVLQSFPSSPREGPSFAALSPDGKVLAAGGARLDRVRLLDVATGKSLRPALGPQGGILAVALSPDGKLLATGSRDNTIRLWEPATGKELRTLRGHTGAVSFLAFAPDGRHLASASMGFTDHTVRWWDTATGQEVQQFEQGTRARALALSADGKRLAAADFLNRLHLWDTATGKGSREKVEKWVLELAFDPGGKTVGLLGSTRQDPWLKVRDVDRWSGEGRRVDLPKDVHVRKVVFAPGARTVVLVTSDLGLWQWDVPTGEPVRWLRRGTGQVPTWRQISSTAVPVFSRDGRLLAVPDPGGAVRVLEASTGEVRHVFHGGQGPIACLAFSADRTRLVSGSEDGTALVWDLKTAGLPIRDDLSDKELQALWAALGDADPVKGYRAVQGLTAAPRQAVALLRKRLPPSGAAEQKRLAQLIAELGSKELATRTRAEAALRDSGLQARPALRQVLKGKPTLDLRQRVERLLQRLQERRFGADELRLLRAVEAVEAIGSAEARKLFTEWAGGAREGLLTEEARAALERLAEAKR
jgi:WD40 repeat protein